MIVQFQLQVELARHFPAKVTQHERIGSTAKACHIDGLQSWLLADETRSSQQPLPAVPVHVVKPIGDIHLRQWQAVQRHGDNSQLAQLVRQGGGQGRITGAVGTADQHGDVLPGVEVRQDLSAQAAQVA